MNDSEDCSKTETNEMLQISQIGKTAKLARAAKIFRLFRFLKMLVQQSKGSEIVTRMVTCMKCNSAAQRLTQFFVIFLMVVHLFSCSWLIIHRV